MKILQFVFLLWSLLSSICRANSGIQECYGELLPYLQVDNIPEQVVNKTFPVKARMASSAIHALHNLRNTASVIVSVRLYGYGFDVNDSSAVMQDIAKEDGTWEWEVTAKNAGNNQEISFEVVLQDEHPILNCLHKQQVNVINIPLIYRLWDDICKQWITITLAMCSLTMSIISICLIPRKS